jgi:hypothetical protein
MTTAADNRLTPTTTTTTADAPAYSECGAGGQRQLTIGFSPSSVAMLVLRRTISLHGETWEYCFTGDTPLELRFVGSEPFVGLVRPLGATAMTSLTGLDGALLFTCTRPASDEQDEQYEFVFSRSTTSGSVAHPPVDRPPHPHGGAPGMPKDIQSTSAQPTLIIRTKKTCPTGVNNPTVEA